ncbi:hypothetical protein [Geomonas oryzae]|uniref:hypothetical protein n=1 Tax=Geomonas oryzae TaxID=2364273 RepID=UPI00100A68A2|nr:hypothetical protein [Geomonas oryzae]
MTDILQKLQSAIESQSAETELLQEALQEIREMKQKRDALEEILIVLARTKLPWDDEEDPVEALPHFKERYLNAMHEASRLLGLDVRSTITRTEPKT